jgi:pimeloyl-ACP methyl ester carboxylesterase
MRRLSWIAGVLAVIFFFLPSRGAARWQRNRLEHLNHRLHGQIVDFTHNHGADNRIWSAALHQRRDLYVYLPPGFNPHKSYPIGIYLHGANQDENAFLDTLVELYDQAMSDGRLPPTIVAVPDGSIQGRQSLFNSASFFANSKAGNFEDYVIVDVWNFMMEHFPIRPEREFHALMGASMGGAAAFSLAMKHKYLFKAAVGVHPALNMRWVDCHDHYRASFDPCCWGWRTHLHPNESLGRIKGAAIRFKYLLDPVVGRGPDAIEKISGFNPIELLDSYDIREGDLDMFVAYGGKDELNIAAQVESFLYHARERGLTIGVAFDPNGRHDLATGVRLFPLVGDWNARRLANYKLSMAANDNDTWKKTSQSQRR